VTQSHISWFAIIISFFIAATLELIALPDMVAFLRPEWLVVTYVYWLVRHPEKIGVASGVIVGLLLDVISGSYFGIHILAVCLTGYLVLTMHQRLKMFPISQQSLVIFFIVGIQLMVVSTIKSALGNSDIGLSYLWLAFSSAIIWPFVLIVTDRLVFALR